MARAILAERGACPLRTMDCGCERCAARIIRRHDGGRDPRRPILPMRRVMPATRATTVVAGTWMTKMTRISRLLGVALLAGLPLVTPAVVHAEGDGETSTPLSVPNPLHQLDTATAELQRGNIQRADSLLSALQNRLLNDSNAWNTPAYENTVGWREAVPILDRARMALRRGDTTNALNEIAAARPML